MMTKAKLYSYVGPKELEKYATSDIVRSHISSQESVKQWMQHTRQEKDYHGEVTATYVVDANGKLWVTDRHYEHIACARGEKVLAAGEMSFALDGEQVYVSYLSNQSTGYCPEPESWYAVEKALQGTDLSYPAGWSVEFIFRRCEQCLSINIVKNGDYDCAVCDSRLSKEWNF